MRRFLCLILAISLLVTTLSIFTGCDGNGDKKPTETPIPEDIDPSTVDIIGETWRVTELTFTSTKKYVAAKGEQARVIFDGIFTHKETGETLTIPGFWYGEDQFKIRFAPTKYGVWEYEVKCETDPDLNGHTGTIGANAYKGDLEIYKRGFVKAELGTKYFMYDDGTPFFYLGDTHWSMLSEEFDSAGDRAGNIQTDSHFKYIVDKRVEQGFTVYQSEPIGARYDVTDGRIDRQDADGFKHADQYFQYIAEKGLVHANAQFFFPVYGAQIAKNNKALEALSRYWVARFGAYPVMWTLAQEIDNDFYYERGDQNFFNVSNNPWVKVAEYMHKYDAYNHPLSGHQEGAGHTTVNGASVTSLKADNNGASAFVSEEVTQRTGHSWWAAQWGIDFQDVPQMHRIAEEYWASNKVGVMYEGKYCGLWTKDAGARAQGWFAYLSGSFGYGYGATDIWSYKSTYSQHAATGDGRDVVSVEYKQKYWSEAIEFVSGYQVGYMRAFLEQFEWWNLKPDFDKQNYFIPNAVTSYACATIGGNEIYIVYVFSQAKGSGNLAKLDPDATYTIKWYDPRNNEYYLIGEKETANAQDHEGNPVYMLPDKPNCLTDDWVILATKNK